MSHVHIRSGTAEKSSDSYFSITPDVNGKRDFEIKISDQVVSLYGEYKGSASGGLVGEYGVKRIGGFWLPMELVIDLCTRGLLEGPYKLTEAEMKKLLLAVSASISTTKETP